MIVASTREFVRAELVPHEREIEDTGVLREDLWHELRDKAIAAGLYAANMLGEEAGGGGLEGVSWALYEKELGHTSYALQYGCVARPRTSCWLAPGSSVIATCCRRCAASGWSAWP